MNLDASVVPCVAGNRRRRVSGVAAPVAIRNTSFEAAAQCGTHSQHGDCVPVVRTNGVTRHACSVMVGPYTKIGMQRIMIDQSDYY
jgi:hypothetical protein